ncbi:uncharacterized protein LOC110035332, partial [Phalaenopsis equestris]|uniref:uncharacterized protein LOC110035332 n=1 Tax=Phalaenopsis equestris TaxID=78828 RepID=UPI0009E2AF33
MPLNIDLNKFPVESEQFEDAAALLYLKHKQISSIGCLGSVSSLSDENGIGYDVELQLSSACFSSARCPSRRKRPAKVAFDESQSRRKCPVTVAKGPSRKKRPATVAFDESQSRRKQPVTVVNDESLETDTSQSGVLCLPIYFCIIQLIENIIIDDDKFFLKKTLESV